MYLYDNFATLSEWGEACCVRCKNFCEILRKNVQGFCDKKWINFLDKLNFKGPILYWACS